MRRLVVLLLMLLAVSAVSPGRAETTCSTGPAPQSVMSANIQRYHKVWKIVKEHYYLPERLTEWSAWEHRYDSVLCDDGTTRWAIEEMLASLDDDFCYLNEPEETSEADRKYRRDPGCVTFMKLPENIGYIKINSFKCKSVVKEVRRALAKLGDKESYVLDLRGNPGGFVKLTCRVFAMFVDHDRFISYVSREKDRPSTAEMFLTHRAEFLMRDGKCCYKAARESDILKHKPLVVIVDDQTRSAAEMLAGALREDGMASLVGVKTFGKGVLQNTWELDDGSSVKIVTGRYFLPRGECIHGVGLEPDLVVPAVAGCGVDVQLEAAMRTLMLQRQVTHAGQPANRVNL